MGTESPEPVDPEEGSVRLVLFGAMAALVVVALAVPEAFGDHGLIFAIAYRAVRIAHLALFVLASQDDPDLRHSVQTLAVSTALGIGLITGAAFLDDYQQGAVWTLPILIDFGGPAIFRLLIDSGGPYQYEDNEWRAYFVSERAHNTVSVDNEPMESSGSTVLFGQRHTDELDFVALCHERIPGTVHIRRVLYSRVLDLLVVADDFTSESPRTYRQWWHLHPESQPRLVDGGLVTERAGGPNLSLQQLLADGTPEVFVGSRDPVQGWMTPRYNELVPAPAVSFSKQGMRARFVTLIAPSDGEAIRPSVSEFEVRPGGGFDMILTVRDMRARFRAGADTASQSTPRDAQPR